MLKLLTGSRYPRLGWSSTLKLDGLPVWLHGLAWGGTLALAGAMLVLPWCFHDMQVWEGLAPARELERPSYAERIQHDAIFRTPVNTFSNLFFVLVGFYVLALGLDDHRRWRSLSEGYLAATPAQSFLFGCACIYVGLGSAHFHGSLTRLGQQLDVGGMYAVVIAMGSICLGSWLPHIRCSLRKVPLATWPLLCLFAVLASIYFLVFKWSSSFRSVATFLGAVMIVFAISRMLSNRVRLQARWGLAALAAFVWGLHIRRLDIDGRFASPDSLFQGHSVWHLLAAVFLAGMYLYYRSEQRLYPPAGDDAAEPDKDRRRNGDFLMSIVERATRRKKSYPHQNRRNGLCAPSYRTHQPPHAVTLHFYPNRTGCISRT